MSAFFNPYAAPRAIEPIPSVFAPPLLGGRTFRLREVVRSAWRAYRRQPFWLATLFLVQELVAFAVTFSVSAAIGWFALRFATNDLARSTATLFPELFALVVASFFASGAARVALTAARGESPRVGTLFSGIDVLLPQLLSSVCCTLLIALGAVALLVPGVVLALALSMVGTVLADRRCSAIEAIRASFALTRGARLKLLLLAVASCVVLALGVAALGFGLLFASPFVSVVWAEAYRTLADER